MMHFRVRCADLLVCGKHGAIRKLRFGFYRSRVHFSVMTNS